MGNCNCNKNQKNINYNKNDWYITSVNQHSLTIVNKYNTNIQFQKWVSPRQENQIIYDWRNKESSCLQELHSYGKQFGFDKNNIGTFTITDPLLQFKYAKHLTQNQCLYLIKIITKALKVLITKFGYFQLTQDMIFLTKKGRVTIWVNANLAINFPTLPLLPHNGVEQRIIQEILIIVQKKCTMSISFLKNLKLEQIELKIQEQLNRYPAIDCIDLKKKIYSSIQSQNSTYSKVSNNNCKINTYGSIKQADKMKIQNIMIKDIAQRKRRYSSNLYVDRSTSNFTHTRVKSKDPDQLLEQLLKL